MAQYFLEDVVIVIACQFELGRQNSERQEKPIFLTNNKYSLKFCTTFDDVPMHPALKGDCLSPTRATIYQMVQMRQQMLHYMLL